MKDRPDGVRVHRSLSFRPASLANRATASRSCRLSRAAVIGWPCSSSFNSVGVQAGTSSRWMLGAAGVTGHPLRPAEAFGPEPSVRRGSDGIAAGPAFPAPAMRKCRKVCRLACHLHQRIAVFRGNRGGCSTPVGRTSHQCQQVTRGESPCCQGFFSFRPGRACRTDGNEQLGVGPLVDRSARRVPSPATNGMQRMPFGSVPLAAIGP